MVEHRHETLTSPSFCNSSLMHIAFKMGQLKGETNVRLADIQKTTDDILARIVAMQTAPTAPPPSGPTWTLRSLIGNAKTYAEGFELLQKLWHWRRTVFLPLLMYGWWDYVAALLRLLGW